MKKFICFALTVIVILSVTFSVLATTGIINISVDPSIKILVNGKEFQPKDVNGNDVMTFVYNGTTYAPLRAMAEAFGLEVGYDSDKKMATVDAAPSTTQIPTTQTTSDKTSSTFSVQFIDVGQADATLIECDGHYMLIDGGNKADSNVIYTVLKNANVKKLDIVVGTHAHEDHIGGIPGAFNYTSADLTLCPVTNYDSDAFKDFAKYANEKGGGITVPSVGDTYSLGSSIVTILGVNGGSETNDTSIVLKIQYGNTSFLFTGDAEREAEQVILDSGADISATVIKVGHHGSETSTTYPFLREIMPQYAVISVGENNSYGHPTDDTLSRLRDADVKVYRTDMQGDIYCTSDGVNVTISTTRNANADTLIAGTTSSKTESESNINNNSNGTYYVLNTNTKKIHYPSCSSAKSISDKNRATTTDYAQAIAAGYEPCKRCNP